MNIVFVSSNSTSTFFFLKLAVLFKTPSISLLENEVCYYEEKAKAYHEKNVVTGRTGAGAGVSFRVAKGVSMRTGGGASQVVRGNVSEVFTVEDIDVNFNSSTGENINSVITEKGQETTQKSRTNGSAF